MTVDVKSNLRMMISRLEDELSEHLDNRPMAARLRKRIDKLTAELADKGGYFANPSGGGQRRGVESRAEAMQESYSNVGNALFALKWHLEGVEQYYATGQDHESVEIRFKARDLVKELDGMIRSDEFQALNDEIFFLAEMMRGRRRR